MKNRRTRGGWQELGKKDGVVDLDLYSAIVASSSAGAVSRTLNNKLPVFSSPSRATLLFIRESHGLVSSGISKEQTRGYIAVIIVTSMKVLRNSAS